MIRVLTSAVACLAVLAGCHSSKESIDEPSPKAGSKIDTVKKPAGKDVEEKESTGPVKVFHDSWKEVPLDDAVGKGLKWLLSVQGDDGGWGQDGGRSSDPRKGVKLETSVNDVANTSLVCLALLRSGHSPGKGQEGMALLKGIEFILGHVEKAPEKGLSVTERKGTQIQRKLGPNIDTFLSTLVLAQVDGEMADAKAQGRVKAGLQKCIAKVETNQGKDGSWNSGGGWAPVIGTSIASRGLYVAQGKGNAVQVDVLYKVNEYTASNWDSVSGTFAATKGGAGVELYQAAQALEQSSRTSADRTTNAALIAGAQAKLSSTSIRSRSLRRDSYNSPE